MKMCVAAKQFEEQYTHYYKQREMNYGWFCALLFYALVVCI